MKIVTKISILSAVSALVFLGAGCISFGGPAGGGPASDGGIFKTSDRGENWTLKSSLPTVTGEKRSFSNSSVNYIIQDPQDPNAAYIGTADNGMFYTYDGGNSWFRPADLTRGRVWSIAVHPKNKCIVFATISNKLVKSEDCSRSWDVPFLDSRVNVATKAIAIDSYNPNIIWLGLSTGDLLRSQDSGNSWTNVHSFKNEIIKLIVSPSDTRRVFVATKSDGIWRTDDGGANWLDLKESYKEFKGAKDFLGMAVGVSDPQVVIFASKFGLIRSRNFGDSWEGIDLLTPPGQSMIYSLAIDPKDVNTIYYGTATTFNKTSNGGANWITKRLPTTRAATVLHVDQTNSDIICMGATKFKN